MFMEYCLYTLHSYLTSTTPPTGDHRKSVLYQASLAIEYLHAQDLVHRDLKPDNVMVKEVTEWPLVKVMDFSFAKDLSGQEDSQMVTVRGNNRWMAPEMLDENGRYNQHACYRRAVDSYCLGLLFAFICVNHQMCRGIFGTVSCK